MYMNGFSVKVIPGNEVAGGYVEIAHGTVYRLALRNDTDVRCDARVEIDGTNVGKWRIEAHDRIELERGAGSDGQFTAYLPGTHEGNMAGVDYSNPKLGLIGVEFTPEKRFVREANLIAKGFSPQANSMGGAERGAIGTGLSGHSGQQFGQAGRIRYDFDAQVIIYLRLKGVPSANDGPRPLVGAVTPVPPRLY